MARAVERIRPFMNLVKTEVNSEIHQILKLGLKDKFEEVLKNLEAEWVKFPDLRFTQLLVNTGLIPNVPGTWYYLEEEDFFPENSNKLIFWGTYGKDGKSPLKRIPIESMETEHILACLKTQKHMSSSCRNTMMVELKNRKVDINASLQTD